MRFVIRMDQERLLRKVVFAEDVGGRGFSGSKSRTG